MQRTPWALVVLLVGAGMVAAFQVGKAPPAIPSLRATLDASLGQAGWLLSGVNLTTALAGLPIALSADRIGHRRLLLLGTATAGLASLIGAFLPTIELLLIARFVEGLGFIAAAVTIPSLLMRLAAPADQRLAMTLWSTYMPMGAGSMMLLAALVLPSTTWRTVWLLAAAAAGLALLALLRWVAPRPDLGRQAVRPRPVLREAAEVAGSGGPLAIAVCFAAYSCCWFIVVGFLPTLQVERLGMATAAASVVTALVTIANVAGNLGGGWLLRRGVPRVAVIVGAASSMALCAAAVFADGVPDLARLLLAGLYSAVIGMIPVALFTAIPVHVPRPELVGAGTGLLMQGSSVGALLGPPLTGGLVAAHGWPAAAWATALALAIAALAGVFLHWRERRKLAP